MATPEQQPRSNESLTPKVGPEHYEQARETVEKRAEAFHESGEVAAERAKHEALESAVSVESSGAERASRGPAEPQPSLLPRPTRLSRKQKDEAYKKHMGHVQAELTPTGRAFSKFIHAKPIEKTSEVIGDTIARPNAILASAFLGFVLVLAVYLLARHYGYVLSGFETIGAFAIGWLLGILYDFFKVMITGKK